MEMVMAMMARAMVMATRVASEGQQGQWQRQGLWQATMRAMAMARRVASNMEGEGGKVMATVTRVMWEHWQQQGRVQWQWQQE
jgi:hypothetical protein